jgi:hypothetical protein
MAKSAFLITNLIFQSDTKTFEVTTDSDYVYIENIEKKQIIKIDIQDWFEIVDYIEKRLK